MDFGRVYENIVYLELRRRGYEVYVGKTTKGEIDFVAVKDGKSITSAYLLATEDVIEREFGAYKDIQDHYPKYVVTLNEMDVGIENGIRIVHLRDFLLAKQW